MDPGALAEPLPGQPHPSPKPDALSPHRVWFALLCGRIADVIAKMPRLSGTIQFEIQREQMSPVFFYLHVAGKSTVGLPGLARDVDTWISTSEAELEAMLSRKKAAAGALRVSGDRSLAEKLFDALAKVPAAKSWVGMQVRK